MRASHAMVSSNLLNDLDSLPLAQPPIDNHNGLTMAAKLAHRRFKIDGAIHSEFELLDLHGKLFKYGGIAFNN